MNREWRHLYFLFGVIAACIMVAYLIASARSQEVDEEGEPVDINPTSSVDDLVGELAYIRCSKTSDDCINFIFPNLFHCQNALTSDQFCLAVNDND